MIEWTFYIDDLLISQPAGFADILLNANRHKDWHGVFFEASTTDLIFTDEAADYLIDKKKIKGLKAEVIFKALYRCDESGIPEQIIKGRLNFGQYKSRCGDSCFVSMPVEQDNCVMLIDKRYDQKVDIDSLKAFDGFTSLQSYPRLGFTMPMPAKELLVSTEGFVSDAGDVVDLSIFAEQAGRWAVRPTYGRIIYEAINESQLLPSVFAAATGGGNETALSPIVLLNDDIKCFSGNFSYNIRLRGSYDFINDSPITTQYVRIIMAIGEYAGTDPLNIIHSQDLGFTDSTAQGTFDTIWSGNVVIPNGQGLYIYFTSVPAFFLSGTVTFEKETYVNISGVKTCPPTTAKVYCINETLSRITEAITNNCVKVKSDYYGRTDSKPYTSGGDGCGSLRVVAPGLFLRNAIDAIYFVSLKDCFDGLNPIDNIGFGIEDDPLRPGSQMLRIEDVRYFYRDEEILSLHFVPTVDINVEEAQYYALVKIGYDKWEVQNINGLDEFNSTREFRTSLTSVDHQLILFSKFIAGSYPIEITRQQSFADSGGADTKYDNETFIVCVKRAGADMVVEQGNVTTPTNIFSPNTIYNWRIRPYYNLMRWFKSIASIYPNISDTDNKFFFSAGVGNYKASGQMTDTTCKMENGVKAENKDLSALDFINLPDYIPIYRPETVRIKYPMSIGQYKKLMSNPYGYVSVQCGTGEWIKGFINSIQFRLTKGECDLQLKLKW